MTKAMHIWMVSTWNNKVSHVKTIYKGTRRGRRRRGRRARELSYCMEVLSGVGNSFVRLFSRALRKKPLGEVGGESALGVSEVGVSVGVIDVGVSGGVSVTGGVPDVKGVVVVVVGVVGEKRGVSVAGEGEVGGVNPGLPSGDELGRGI